MNDAVRKCGHPLGRERWCPDCELAEMRASEAAHGRTVRPLVNPWHPITNSVDLKHLGKLGEELSECGAATARCIIQGIDEREPVTGKLNREWLEDEIADVQANIGLVALRFGLDQERMARRTAAKFAQLQSWHAMA